MEGKTNTKISLEIFTMKNLKSKKFSIILTGIIAISLVFTPTLLHAKNTSSKPNIILITVDALRPDHLSCYGYKRDTQCLIFLFSVIFVAFLQQKNTKIISGIALVRKEGFMI